MEVNFNISHRHKALEYAMALWSEGAISSSEILGMAEAFYNFLAQP